MVAAVRGEEKKDGGILGGEVDDDNNNDNNGGPSPRMRHCQLLADIRGDDGMIGGLLEAHHR
jgi:hypothetical protein